MKRRTFLGRFLGVLTAPLVVLIPKRKPKFMGDIYCGEEITVVMERLPKDLIPYIQIEGLDENGKFQTERLSTVGGEEWQVVSQKKWSWVYRYRPEYHYSSAPTIDIG